MSDLSKLSRQELQEYAEILEKRRKFGLVWNEEFSIEKLTSFERETIPILNPLVELNLGELGEFSNVLLKGENLDALRLLRFTHANAFDVIYIDPPYNTGNKDFKYNDQWVDKEDPYRHSKWLTFMESRLKIAKELLHSDGLIFISIGDDEGARLQVLADQIFGEMNRLGPLIWFYEGVNDNNAYIKKTHEYILVYQATRSVELSKNLRDPNVELADLIENSVVKNGPKNPPSVVTLPAGFPAYFKEGKIKKNEIMSLDYDSDIVVKNFKLVNEVNVTSGWSSKGILLEFIGTNFKEVLDSKGQLTEFGIMQSGNINYRKKRDQSYVLSVLRNLGTVAHAGSELKSRGISFNYPKPVGLLKHLISIHGNKDALILDFFAGSGTTGEAVLSLNKEDGGSRSFVLVTNNEGQIFDEVCYPRLKSVIKGYKNSKKDKVEGIGGNLRVFEIGEFSLKQNPDDIVSDFAIHAIELLKLKHNNFEVIEESDSYQICSNAISRLGIYSDLDVKQLDTFLKVFEDSDLPKILYLFSFSSDGTSMLDGLEHSAESLGTFPMSVINVLRRR